MALEPAAVEHVCNVIRRQIQEEFPDLTLHFIVYEQDKMARTLDMKRRKIADHPAAEALLPLAERALKAQTAPQQPFLGMATAREKKFIRWLARPKTLGCFLVCGDRFENEDEVRHYAYSLVWQALSLYTETGVAEKPGEVFVVVPPPCDDLTGAWRNMLADVFASLMMEMQGKKGFIRALARKCCSRVLTAEAGYSPENFPYPVVMDATLIIFDDLRREGLAKAKLHGTVLDMAREIGSTFDTSTVLQWWAFCKPAQEMAWLGTDKNKILGAALHTSEDPYARATAYLVAEVLNIEPGSFSDITLYNPFTDPEVNQRHHRKICDDLFENLLSKATSSGNGGVFYEEAAARNRKLLAGQLIGWCTPALLAAGGAFNNHSVAAAERPDAARAAFRKASVDVNTEILRRFGQIIIAERQAGRALECPALADMAASDELLAPFAEPLRFQVVTKAQ